MKTNIIFIFILLLISQGCEYDLVRDNPLDEKNNTNTINGVAMKYMKYEVAYDSNNDGKINKGETIYLLVYLVNNGTNTANSIKASFSTNSSYVSLFTPTTQVNYGSISSGNSTYGDFGNAPDYSTYTIKFTVSSTTPTNTSIPININISDGGGNSWTASFSVTVEATTSMITYSKYSVAYDNNNDGKVNKGETVYLLVNLINSGSSTSNSVKATFSTTSSFVSLFSPTTQVSYGNISSGSTTYGDFGNAPNYNSYTIKFTVSNTTPINTQIPISINITDESGNVWTSSFNVLVEATNAQIAFSSFSIAYDNNNDGIINKGETVYLLIRLSNNGSSTANSVKATFSTTNSFVSVFSPTTQINFGNISSGSSTYGDSGNAPNYNSYTIKFTVSSSIPTNAQISINMAITDESLNTWSSSFNVTVQ